MLCYVLGCHQAFLVRISPRPLFLENGINELACPSEARIPPFLPGPRHCVEAAVEAVMVDRSLDRFQPFRRANARFARALRRLTAGSNGVSSAKQRAPIPKLKPLDGVVRALCSQIVPFTLGFFMWETGVKNSLKSEDLHLWSV